jgi:hypothetical protein
MSAVLEVNGEIVRGDSRGEDPELLAGLITAQLQSSNM